MQQASQQASQAGEQLSDSLGKKPQEAMQQTQKQARRLTWELRGHIKDISRVVFGILISQAFYTILRYIRTMISEAFELLMLFEELAVSFEYLMDTSPAIAEQAAHDMRYWALNTQHSIQEVSQAFQELYTAGVQVGEIESAVQILADTAAATGKDLQELQGVMRRVAAAPVVTTSTVRVLERTGIEVAPILREQLGLTREEMEELNRLGIPGHKMFRALMHGLSDFEGAAEDMARTTRALGSDLWEVLTDILGTLFTNRFENLRDWLEETVDWFARVRQGLLEMGPAFLKHLIPPGLRTPITNFIEGLMAIYHHLGRILSVTIDIARDGFLLLASTVGQVIPIIAGIVGAIADLVQWVQRSVPGLRQLVQALTAMFIVITLAAWFRNLARLIAWTTRLTWALTSAKTALTTVMTTLTRHPWAVILTTIAFAIAYTTGALESLVGSISRAVDEFEAFPEWDDQTEGAEKLAEEFEKVPEHVEDAKDQMEGFLAEFDEVYGIQEDEDDEFDPATLPDLPPIEAQMPDRDFDPSEIMYDPDEVEQLGFKISDVIDNIIDKIREVLEEIPIIGEPLADLLGIIQDPLVEVFSYLDGWLGSIATMLGVWALGSLLRRALTRGLPGIGRWLLGKLGTYIGAPLAAWWSGKIVPWIKGLPGKILAALKALPGKIVPWIKGLPGKILAALKALPGKLWAFFAGLGPKIKTFVLTKAWPFIKKAFIWVGKAIAGVIGFWPTVILGALAGVGYVFYEWGDDIIEWMRENVIEPLGDMWEQFTDWFRENVTEPLRDRWDEFVEWFFEKGSEFIDWWRELPGRISDFLEEAGDTLYEFFTDDLPYYLGYALGYTVGWVSDMASEFADWASETYDEVTDWISDTASEFAQWASETLSEFVQWASDTASEIAGWASDTASEIYDWAKNITWDDITTWVSDTASEFAQWASDTLSEFTQWASDTASEFAQWASDTLSEFVQWASDTASEIAGWAVETYNEISDWVSDTLSRIWEWMTELPRKIADGLSDAIDAILEWTSDAYDAAAEVGEAIFDGVIDYVTDIPGRIGTAFSNAVDTVGGWVSDAYDVAKDAGESFTDGVEDGMDAHSPTRIERIMDSVREKSDDVSKAMQDVFSGLARPLRSIWGRIADAISSTWDELVEHLMSTMKEITEQLQELDTRGGTFDVNGVAERAGGDNLTSGLTGRDSGRRDGGLTREDIERLADRMASKLQATGNGDKRPLYVGTLIADRKGLKELERRMYEVREEEGTRLGGGS